MAKSKIPEMDAPMTPSIDVKIYLPKDSSRDYGKLLGFASVNLGGVFAVNNIRIYGSEKGPFVAMPSTKGQGGRYHDICCPTTKEMRTALENAVLEAYQQEAERSSVRGTLKNNTRAIKNRPPQVNNTRTTEKGAR